MSFRHLLRLSDEVGLLEHAEGIVPRRDLGYCVDDVARGLVAVCQAPDPAPELVTLARRYLNFLSDAQADDGRFRNRLGYDRRWEDEPGVDDCWGRAVWGHVTGAVSPLAESVAPFLPSGGWRIYTVSGSMPRFDPASWRLEVGGLVDRPLSLDYRALRALPRVEQVSTFHCVTGWTVRDVHWAGVRVHDVLAAAGPRPAGHALRFTSAEHPYVDYLTDDQAMQAIFPGEKLTRKAIELTPQEIDRIESLSGEKVRNSTVIAWVGAGKKAMFVDQVVGKHEFITYAVGVGGDKKVAGVEIMEYRESFGHEVRRAEWRKQFVGKDSSAPLKLKKDIINLSGATLSSSHVTGGVRRMIRTYEVIRERL